MAGSRVSSRDERFQGSGQYPSPAQAKRGKDWSIPYVLTVQLRENPYVGLMDANVSDFMSANGVLRLPQNNGTLNTAVQPSRNNLVPREGMQWSRPSSSLPLLDKHCAVPSKYPPSLYEVLAGQAEYAQGCICNHPDQVKTSQSSQG
ncbi:hypothetical protein FOQG_09592 [Fusarium oxysporum f. sp. raphani 54005]|uniref:Uncharacterized protein n=4 Tax=Fusarium oxysporum TaxID=5507 RepID=X0CWF3_FUSOX|nr:hypothetical protein FOVG_00859 [Fusarium oxysporum f. sp. pisi HDV247]EXK86797.1 hypothetical protein FOQG_09592 [Fusarium oxysporum f. sp. raphani 54005]EXL87035.1 hypothetical protein FOPG_01909 [Fusarium oxysporum f. sp. conglutinans race 2 54008]EXM27724.1 hypothetical protein FOTG_06084 [Fusarium oxysporum f. sp. vasinfectum 25433]